MADKMTPEQRSHCMRRIRSKNTRPEMLVRRFLFSHGVRYRVHVKSLPGTPDLAIAGLRTCIFINGCFWHGHEGCSLYRIPQTHVDFWTHKILRNKERDHENRLALKSLGWHMVEVWECQLKPKVRERTLQGLLRTLNYIALENHGAILSYDFSTEEKPSLAAEEIGDGQ
ncbi:MAG: DNA mismatch endonuclease Vsr [Bacteroidales bacterium]|mgnify:FL=1|nr:DNA mismatch endonuclease Vsr [Bacteroidales bacterium]